ENEENILSTADVLSTDKEKVSTAKENVSTDKPIVSTDGSKVSTDRQIKATQTPTSTIFGDDETIAKVLLNMSQAKAVSREKEKGVELKDIEETDRPKPTSTRSLLFIILWFSSKTLSFPFFDRILLVKMLEVSYMLQVRHHLISQLILCRWSVPDSFRSLLSKEFSLSSNYVMKEFCSFFYCKLLSFFYFGLVLIAHSGLNESKAISELATDWAIKLSLN
ncbi:hypothetical protein Tco_1364692, partial [Tanacetum coccineum]